MNAALWLTASRIAAIPALMALLLADPSDSYRWAAFGVYAAAALTDSLDGWLARSRGQVTVAGAFLDPLADKLLVSAALLCLVQQGRIGAWAVMIIITREFAVTGLRLVAAGARLIIPASNFGKAKTVSQNLAVVAYIVPHRWEWVNTPLLDIALVLTVLSGAYYFILARKTLFAPRGAGAVDRGEP